MTAEVYTWMLDELQANGLSVAKIRTDSGYVRVALSQNAPWYRDFCENYKGTRRRHPRPRTIIKRLATIATLKKLIRDTQHPGVYAERLRALAEQLQRENT